VGSVIRLRIFSSVLFPAPLRPMMPTTSPSWMSKSTSFSAQNSSDVARAPAGRLPRSRPRADFSPSAITSRKTRYLALSPRWEIRYFLPRPSVRMIVAAMSTGPSNHIRERPLGAAEVASAEHDQDGSHEQGEHPAAAGEWVADA